MKFFVEVFDKTTELLVFEFVIPAIHDEQVKAIMEWTTEQQGWEGYDLSADQLVALEKLVNENLDTLAYDFQLTVNA